MTFLLKYIIIIMLKCCLFIPYLFCFDHYGGVAIVEYSCCFLLHFYIIDIIIIIIILS